MTEERLRERLRERGLRLTPQRELVLRAVESLGHATPDQVYAEVRAHSDAVNLSTVYRTLNWLEERGFVSPRRFDDNHAHKHFDPVQPDGGHVHHFHCRNCDRVIEFSAPQVELFLEQIRGEIARQHGLRVDDAALVLSGLCTDCAAKS